MTLMLVKTAFNSFFFLYGVLKCERGCQTMIWGSLTFAHDTTRIWLDLLIPKNMFRSDNIFSSVLRFNFGKCVPEVGDMFSCSKCQKWFYNPWKYSLCVGWFQGCTQHRHMHHLVNWPEFNLLAAQSWPQSHGCRMQILPTIRWCWFKAQAEVGHPKSVVHCIQFSYNPCTVGQSTASVGRWRGRPRSPRAQRFKDGSEWISEVVAMLA